MAQRFKLEMWNGKTSLPPLIEMLSNDKVISENTVLLDSPIFSTRCL